jgi:peptide/nickel transport system substrate-binding protein
MKKIFKRLIAAALGVSIVIASLTGCGYTGDTQSNDANESSVKTEFDELTIGVGSLSSNFVPMKDMGTQTLRVMYNIYDTLFKVNSNGDIVGSLAESWEYTDATTLKINLRKDVKFHNGDALTAEDVKFSIDLALAAELGTAVTNVIDSIDSAEVTDTYTLLIKTKYEDPILLTRLSATRTLYVLPKNYYESVGGLDGFNAAPIGSGPYKISSLESGVRIVLERNDDYFGDKAYVKKVNFVKYAESSTRITALANKEVDIINDISNDLQASVKANANVDTIVSSVNNFHVYVFNTENGITANKQFRQALAYGINRQLLVDTLWGSGAYVPNGFQTKDNGDLYLDDYTGVQYDKDKAISLVKESGYDGSEIELEIQAGYYMNDVVAAQAIVDMWKDIGVNAKVVLVDSANWNFKNVRSWSCAVRYGSLLGSIWIQFGPNTTVQKKVWKSNSAFVEAGYKLQQAKTVEEQRAAQREMLNVLDDEMPVTYLYLPEVIWAKRTDEGIHWNTSLLTDEIISLRAEDFWKTE